MNLTAAILVFNLAYFFRKTHREYIGYYFLLGTALKFFIYFAFVLPVFKEDGHQSKEEFFGFFVPYLVALVVETTALVFLLINNDNDSV
jgi:F0F1-type ATP synthase assembly protein I